MYEHTWRGHVMMRNTHEDLLAGLQKVRKKIPYCSKGKRMHTMSKHYMWLKIMGINLDPAGHARHFSSGYKTGPNLAKMGSIRGRAVSCDLACAGYPTIRTYPGRSPLKSQGEATHVCLT